MNGKYYAGWDGGGTKTAIVCINENGDVLLRKEAGPFNSIGNEKGVLRRAVTDALSFMDELPGGIENCGGLCIGGAGISGAPVRAEINELISVSGLTVMYKLVPDYETAFYGIFGDKPGLVLISGTGSVCYGRNEKGQTHRAGGWGHMIDDEGSGYAIGRDVLAAVVRALDGRAKPTILMNKVFKAWDAKTASEIVTRLYSPSVGKKEIAALSPLCFSTAEQGDETAIEIIDKAANALFDLLHATANALKMKNASTALTGGILLNGDRLAKALMKKAEASEISFSFFKAETDAALGAAYMAKSFAFD